MRGPLNYTISPAAEDL